MKFDSKLFSTATGSVAGAYLTHSSSEDSNLMADLAGAAVGGIAGYNIDTSLPKGALNPLSTEVSLSSSLEKGFDKRASMIDEIAQLKGHASNFANTSTEDLGKMLLDIRKGREVAFNLNNADGSIGLNSFSPQSYVLSDSASLLDKKNSMYSYLVNVASQSEDFAKQRVEELSPFLDRLDSGVVFKDGQMSTRVFGNSLNISLTQTIGDGVTNGYISNGNVYLANNFNVTGSLLATNVGTTEEDFFKVFKNLSIPDNSPAKDSLRKMLLDKKGVSKEAVLGMLSSMGVSDKALVSAIETLETNKQWDEFSTSELLKERVANLNGESYERQVSSYARSISNTTDFSNTLNFGKGSVQVSENKKGSVLRPIGTSSRSAGEHSEMTRVRRKFIGEGDSFSQVKADASTKIAIDSSETLPSQFLPYGRNAGTTGRRALQAADSAESSLSLAFERFKSESGTTSLDSSIALRTRTFDMEKLGDISSLVIGGDMTLADGYSVANSSVMSKYSSTGLSQVSIPTDTSNMIRLNNPLMEKVVKGLTSLSDVEVKSLSFKDVVKFNTSKNQEVVFKELSENASAIANMSSYEEMSNYLRANTSDRLQGSLDYLLNKTDKIIKKEKLGLTDSDLLKTFKDDYIDVIGSKLSLGRKTVDTYHGSTDLAKEMFAKYNSNIGDVVQALKTDPDKSKELFDQSISEFNNARREVVDSYNLINNKPGQTVGYNLEGSGISLPEAHSNYKLKGLETVVGTDNRASLKLYYEGSLNMDENYVGKGFSINTKEQFVNASREQMGILGVLGTLEEKGVIRREGDGIHIIGGALQTGKDSIMSVSNFRESLVNPSGTFNKHTANLIKNTFADFAKNVALVSDTGGTGFKHEKDLLRSIKNNAPNNGVLTDSVWNGIVDFKSKHNTSKKEMMGLVNFGLATTNEKASLATLANVYVGNLTRFDKIKSDLSSSKISEKQAVNQFKKLVPNFNPNLSEKKELRKESLFKQMNMELETMQTELSKRFSDRSNVYKLLSDSSYRESTIDLFTRSANFVSDMSPSRLGIISLNRRAISETGAGTTGKSLSWNAQLQLLSNGYSYDDLDLFGKFSQSSQNDLQAMLGMVGKHQDAINDKVSYGENSAFKNAFNSIIEDRRAAFKNIGIDTGKSVDFYNLSYVPEGSFKSIPIIYDESRLFDSHLSNKTGVQTNRRVTGLMYDIIQADMELQNTSDVDAKKSIQGSLDKLHTKLQNTLKPALSGSTSAAKASLTRNANISARSTVGAINGQMTDFLKEEHDAGRHTSYVAVSKEGAEKRLRMTGIDIENLLETNTKHLERIGNTSLYRLKIDEATPFFGMVNREPATGPMSVRMAEYVVDMSITGEGSGSSVFVKSNDPLYKLFQFGDYDFDNMTEYFTDTNIDKKARDALIGRGRELALNYSELETFASKLGVKNNKSNSMDSLFDVYEKNKANIKTEADWHKYYNEYLESTTRQSGLRKVVSPQVTMLSAALNNSLARDSGDVDKVGRAAKVLSHYFVENLLKAQHAKGDSSVLSEAEELSLLRSGTSQKAYLNKLNQSLEGMIAGHEKGSDEYKLGRNAIDRIVSAESKYMTDAPINSMELGSANQGKTFHQSIENMRNMINGEEQATPLFRRVASDAPNLENNLRVGYDRFKNITNNFLSNNKKTLALGAIGLGGVAIAFRSKSDSVTADVGRQTLAPNTVSEGGDNGLDMNASSDYLTPHRNSSRAVTVEGSYIGDPDDFNNNSRQSVFGDNINSVQVEYRE